jgi:hypothetical protein
MFVFSATGTISTPGSSIVWMCSKADASSPDLQYFSGLDTVTGAILPRGDFGPFNFLSGIGWVVSASGERLPLHVTPYTMVTNSAGGYRLGFAAVLLDNFRSRQATITEGFPGALNIPRRLPPGTFFIKITAAG